MRHPKTRFIQILRIELDDLKDDIDQLLEACREERKKHEFGDHVYLENLAVLNNELLGIGAFSKILDKIDPDQFETLDAMIAELGRAFKAEITSRGLAPAVSLAIERKIAKVPVIFPPDGLQSHGRPLTRHSLSGAVAPLVQTGGGPPDSSLECSGPPPHPCAGWLAGL